MEERPFYDVAYPPSLRDAERELLAERPGFADRARVGLAISGGGIRSATFALGILQGFARERVLGTIDYMSTVSGGGYFGSFLGRLFTREYVENVADVEDILAGPPAVTQEPPNPREQAKWKVVGWLRENGRYLAPRGAGDTLLAGTVLLRNWVSVHSVLGVLVFAVFLLMQVPRILTFHAIQDSSPPWLATTVAAEWKVLEALPLGNWIWWSPWLYVGALPLLYSLPFFWSYWLLRRLPRREKPGSSRRSRPAFALRRTARLGAGVALGVAAAGVLLLFRYRSLSADQRTLALLVSAVAGIFVGAVAAVALLQAERADARARR